jgi:hypothetical protein
MPAVNCIKTNHEISEQNEEPTTRITKSGSGSHSFSSCDFVVGFVLISGSCLFRRKLDVIVGKEQQAFIYILLNDGTGTLGTATPFASGQWPTSIAVGNFNNDGKPDIAVANSASDSVMVNLGDGMGGFSSSTSYLAPATFSVGLGDFNSDGHTDFAATVSGNISVRFGNGLGGFGAASIFYGEGGETLTVGDFNGDGKADLGLGVDETFPLHSRVVVIRGNGLGSFSQPTSFSVGRHTLGVKVASADLNGDGWSDVATGNFGFAGSSVLLSKCPFNNTKVDYDGDNRTDFAIWRPSDGKWVIRQSAQNNETVQFWGLGALGDRPVPGDYDGDRKTDLAIFRPSEGGWYILQSSTNTLRGINWGLSTDMTAPGDYDGDGKMDAAVFRPTTGAWYILRSSDGVLASYFWGIESDLPTEADFDGDGKTDVAVFRKTQGLWYVLRSSDNSVLAHFWGSNGDKPLPGDYDADDMADFAVYRASQNAWFIRRSSNGTFLNVIMPAHTPSHQPAPGDFDGDGAIDVTEWRASTGLWNIRKSSNAAVFSVAHGTSGDVPVVGVYSNE